MRAEPVRAVLDVSEIIGRVRGFVDSVREISAGGEAMVVSVVGFNFSVGKAAGAVDLCLNLVLAVKPKEAAVAEDDFVFFAQKL